MTAQLNPLAAAPALVKEWQRVSFAIAKNIDPSLAALVEVRASQINGCANCINLHTSFARQAGESEQRLYLLAAWREAPCYSERERAALAWTDAMTRLSESPDLDKARDALEAHFTEEEQMTLTLLINVINGWNRIAVGFHAFADPEQVKAQAKQAAA